MPPECRVDSNPNHFEWFGLAPAFVIDEAGLRPRWRELQQTYHPDRAGADPSAQRVALQRAAQVNEAYDTLRDPVRRAAYLLALAGHPLDLERSTVADTDFLMAQLELREALDEADTPAAAAAVAEEAEDWLQQLMREFAQDYADADWSEARDVVRKMQFMRKLMDEAVSRVEALEDEDY